MKDSTGWVHISGTFTRSVSPASSENFAVIPVGFRPSAPIVFPVIQAGNTVFTTYAWVEPDGTLRFTNATSTSAFVANLGLCMDVVYKAVL